MNGDGDLILSANAVRADPTARKGWTVIAALAFGYVGVYLCRKNLAVAVPLFADGVPRQQRGGGPGR